MLRQPLPKLNASALCAMLHSVLRQVLRAMLHIMLRQVLSHCCDYHSPARCASVDFVMNKVVIPPDALIRFRHAASNFAGGVARRVSRLLIIKDDIAALRKRGISYRAIGELLTQNGIPASASGLMRFCRSVLKEKRSRKPSAVRREARSAPPKSPTDVSAKTTFPTTLATTGGTSLFPSIPTASAPAKSRGPRIAKIELLKPK